MKNKTPLVVVGAFLLLIVFLFLFKQNGSILVTKHSSPAVKLTLEEPILRIFDPTHNLSDSIPASLQHVGISLNKSVDDQMQKKLREKFLSGKDIMITIKMLSEADQNLLQEVEEGEFDDALTALCTMISHQKQTVFLRWNPEMEVPVKLYPWQYQAPSDYIKAFQYFSLFCKKLSPKTLVVWAPAGYPGVEEYWPGSKFVDVVSVTLDSKSELMTNAYPRDPDIKTAVRRKMHRVRFMQKPTMILGAGALGKNPATYKKVDDGLAEIRKDIASIYLTAQINEDEVQPDYASSLPVVGVYDPKELLIGSASVKAEHMFVNLTHIQNGSFEKDFKAVMNRKHDAIVTIEPWRDQKARKDTNVLLNTINGVYDDEFKEIYRVVSGSVQTVYLRFAHEMEIPIHRYTWQSQDPVLYIKAFRYFMKFNKAKPDNVKCVWGPAGDRGSMEWWPGSGVVDYVSIALYGLPDKNITDPTKQESFGTIYNRKFTRIRIAGKPVFVTEFGVKGPEDYQKQWMQNAAEVINNHKEIFGVCYFNLADNPGVWGKIPAPDWGINRSTFDQFIQTLSNPR